MSQTKPLSGDILAQLVNATLLNRLREDLLDGAKVGVMGDSLLKLTAFPPMVELKKIYPYDGHLDEDYFENLLRWLRANNGIRAGIYIGNATPNSSGIAAIYVYPKSQDEPDGLPHHAAGIYSGPAAFDVFRVSNGEFSLKNLF